jgi:hypothetical protein
LTALTGWQLAQSRYCAVAQRYRKLARLRRKGLLPTLSGSRRHVGMFGYVRELAEADRELIDAWLEARKLALPHSSR